MRSFLNLVGCICFICGAAENMPGLTAFGGLLLADYYLVQGTNKIIKAIEEKNYETH